MEKYLQQKLEIRRCRKGNNSLATGERRISVVGNGEHDCQPDREQSGPILCSFTKFFFPTVTQLLS
jgi:hypothetical protein